MVRLSRRHPRYRSLVTRARLADAARAGLVVPEGLIAHGRGEAFDYLLGERTTPSARRAERRAAEWIAHARHPVMSINGNVAALASGAIGRLVATFPRLHVEVNLFHRTARRAESIAAALRAGGVPVVLGVRPTGRVPGLPSDRARVDRRGIAIADLCLVPLEDGDRTEALRALGKRVISIDLNPFSRTSVTADLPIIDELTRALERLREDLGALREAPADGEFRPFDAAAARSDAVRRIGRAVRTTARAAERAARRPPPRTSRPRRRTPSRRSRRYRSPR